jgi:hypothetical protein
MNTILESYSVLLRMWDDNKAGSGSEKNSKRGVIVASFLISSSKQWDLTILKRPHLFNQVILCILGIMAMPRRGP